MTSGPLNYEKLEKQEPISIEEFADGGVTITIQRAGLSPAKLGVALALMTMGGCAGLFAAARSVPKAWSFIWRILDLLSRTPVIAVPFLVALALVGIRAWIEIKRNGQPLVVGISPK